MVPVAAVGFSSNGGRQCPPAMDLVLSCGGVCCIVDLDNPTNSQGLWCLSEHGDCYTFLGGGDLQRQLYGLSLDDP